VFEDGSGDYEKKVTEMVSSIFGSEANISVLGMDGTPLEGSVPTAFPLTVGVNDMPLNMALPEGRFYSRAIRVLVEAPVKR
jgi:hypothetical protein